MKRVYENSSREENFNGVTLGNNGELAIRYLDLALYGLRFQPVAA